tara:strand:+ start:5114 stop:5659 length:546 start_codon:yes stop_codon:yes gene_type:complete
MKTYPEMKTYSLLIGDKLIEDILNPHSDQIDLDAIETRLRRVHRFSNDPRAFTIHQHRMLVKGLAEYDSAPEPVVWWAEHHDDHEAVTCDIPGPLMALVRQETNLLDRVQNGLDGAICGAHGRIAPTREVRIEVHTYDKIAETLEWIVVLGQPEKPWNTPLPSWLNPAHIPQLLLNATLFP